MSLADAVAADRAGNLEIAAAAYEGSIAGHEPTLGALLNLALLYWQATDFGLATSKKLDPKFIAYAGKRFPVLLAEAHRAFPESTEVQFWRKYISWADLGEEFSLDECRALLRKDPTTLMPAMHLFAQTQGATHRKEALELLRQCQQDLTTKNQYVASVVVSTLNRKRGKGGDPKGS